MEMSHRQLPDGILPHDKEKAWKNNYRCPYRARKCDGLCNNCPGDLDGENPYDYGTVPVRRFRNMEYPDYEEAILAAQESCYD